MLSLTLSQRTDFTNECGPYKGRIDDKDYPTKTQCISSTASDGKKCCHLSGEQLLKEKSACVEIINTEEERIKLVKEGEEFATKVKVDCGNKKEFISDCANGKKDPKNKYDCSDKSLGDGWDCCYVKIKSEDFNDATACRKFKDINSEKIGEAVVAANTIGAKLKIQCNQQYLINNLFITVFLYLVGALL